MVGRIVSFSGCYRFLSNFWITPISMDGYIYPSVEHAYQASKCASADDRLPFTVGEFSLSPGQARRLGRTVKPRNDWEVVKLEIMHSLVEQKFLRESLRRQLIATGDAELEEGNTWGDTYWGVCRGVGENHLGLILMQVRRELSLK